MTELLVIPSLFTAIAFTGNTSTTRNAAQYASVAYYKQVGLDKVVEPQFKKFEDRYIPATLQRAGVGVTFLYRIAMDKKIELSWSF